MNKNMLFFCAKNAVILFALVSVVLAIVLMSGAHKQDKAVSVYMPIENIKIEGKFEYLLKSQIKQTVIDAINGGYFTVDIEVIRSSLINLPWVEDVSVRRQWPAGLNIEVIEKQAIAYWGKDKLLSDKGELFMPEVIISGLKVPQLDGPEGLHEPVWYFLKETNQRVKELGIFVRRLTLDKRRSWEMQLSNDVVVKLGRDHTEQRLHRFVKVFDLKNAIEMQQIKSIDLRYPNGFAVRLKDTGSDLDSGALVKEV